MPLTKVVSALKGLISNDISFSAIFRLNCGQPVVRRIIVLSVLID